MPKIRKRGHRNDKSTLNKKLKVKTWRAKSNSDEVQTRFQSSAIYYLLIPASKQSD